MNINSELNVILAIRWRRKRRRGDGSREYGDYNDVNAHSLGRMIGMATMATVSRQRTMMTTRTPMGKRESTCAISLGRVTPTLRGAFREDNTDDDNDGDK